MMSFVLLFALVILCVVAALAALWPVLRQARDGVDASVAGRHVLLAALEENERDRAAGRIAAEDAEAARAEIGRRLLATDRAAERQTEAPRGGTVLPVALALLVPLGALGLYGAIGSPGAPDRPLASRSAEAPTITREETEDLVRRAEARLGENPDDARGWLALAPAYRALGRDRDAAQALERALPRLAGTERARALVELTDIETVRTGQVGASGEARLREALAIDPADGRAGFLFAMRAEEARPPGEAAKLWRMLIAQHQGADPPWLALARERATRLEAMEGGATPSEANDASMANGTIEPIDATGGE